MSTHGWNALLRRRWIWTFLFVLVVSVSMVGPTRALGGLVSRSLDAVFILRDLISEGAASRSGESSDRAERSSSEVTRRAADPLGSPVGTPGTPSEDVTVVDLLASEEAIESSSTSSPRQDSNLSPLASGLSWPRGQAPGAGPLGNFPAVVGGIGAGSGSANAISAQSAAVDRSVSRSIESAGVLDEIILQDIALSTSGVRLPPSPNSGDGTVGGATDAGEGRLPGSGDPTPVVPPPARDLLPPGAPLTEGPRDIAPPETPDYPADGPPGERVTDLPPLDDTPPVTVVPEPTPLLLFISAGASWAYRRRIRAASNRRSHA